MYIDENGYLCKDIEDYENIIENSVIIDTSPILLNTIKYKVNTETGLFELVNENE